MKKISLVILSLSFVGQAVALEQQLKNLSAALTLLADDLGKPPVPPRDDAGLHLDTGLVPPPVPPDKVVHVLPPVVPHVGKPVELPLHVLPPVIKNGHDESLPPVPHKTAEEIELENRPVPPVPSDGKQEISFSSDDELEQEPKIPVMHRPHIVPLPAMQEEGPKFASGRYARIDYGKKTDGTSVQFKVGLVEVDPQAKTYNLVAYGPALTGAIAQDFIDKNKLVYPVAKASGIQHDDQKNIINEGPKDAFVLIDGKKLLEQIEVAHKVQGAMKGFLEQIRAFDPIYKKALIGLDNPEEKDSRLDQAKQEAAGFIELIHLNLDQIKQETSDHYANVLPALNTQLRFIDDSLGAIISKANQLKKENGLLAKDIKVSPASKPKYERRAVIYQKYSQEISDLKKKLEPIVDKIRKMLELQDEKERSLVSRLYHGLVDGSIVSSGIETISTKKVAVAPSGPDLLDRVKQQQTKQKDDSSDEEWD